MIIVEGPDGGGKSTYTKNFAESTGYAIHHSGGPIKTIEEFRKRFGILYSCINKDYIFDRCVPVSEYIYGSILKERALITWEQMFSHLEVLQDAEFIYCRPDTHTILINLMDQSERPWKKRTHLTAVKDHIKEIIEAYDLWFLWMQNKHFNIRRYDYVRGKHSNRGGSDKA